MKTNFAKKIIALFTSLSSAVLQNTKLSDTNNREYAVRGRFYYLPEF
jgi:hypothetical protein